ncbi:MAG: T9SS type A sorting domain-containing protein [Bacteroidetes bacterium]|nr:T9SS type A sorting domain-containing protein [Bacteroidota bacterium]MBS1539484.1 T9SS type A sorting domain-containing protein [Bacteroidota bacterium]
MPTDNYLVPNNGVVNLMGLHFQYEQFKSNAVSGNMVYVSNNQIYDTPNRTASPYEVKDAFAIAPTTDNLQGGTHIFRLRSALFKRNVTKTVSSFQADFGDGLGLRNVGFDTDVAVTYATDSVKNIVFQLTYADGQVLSSATKVTISGTKKTCNNCRYSNPTTVLSFPNQAINFPVAAAQMGTGQVTIATAGTDGILDKPLIFVEGFDPFNQYNYYSLIDPNNVGNLTTKVSIDFQGETFGQLLEANNYDLVFLNFDNGADDIARNAYLLENLIYWVNQQTAAVSSTQKNVVVGASMGGLVARYALRDMELRNTNHNTRLYCSIDSPHQGANVPLGFQAAIRYLAGFSIFNINLIDIAPQLGAGVYALNTPAAQQMLIYQLGGTYDGIAVNNTPHTNFQNTYSSMGPPRLWGIRTLAIANGSECAVTQGYSPYSQMLTGSGAIDFNYLQGILLSVWESALTQNTLKYFEGYLTTSSNFSFNVEIRSLPDQRSQRIFYFDLYYHKNILFGLIQSGSDITNYSFNSLANMFPLDNYPGGVFDVRKFAAIPTNIPPINLNLLLTRFNFIPTPSSLDIGSGTQTIVGSDYLRTYSPTIPPTAPKNVPYNNFFSNPLSNENHATLTINNAKWLWQEMQGSPAFFSCSYQCSGTTLVPVISGPSLICSQGTFILTSVPQNATVLWSSSGLVTIGSSTGIASRTNNYNGIATLTASLNGSCGSSSLQQNVWVGNPVFNSISIDGNSGPYPLCDVYNIPFTANQDHTITSNVSANVSGQPASVAYTLSGQSGIVSGSPLSSVTYDFRSKSANTSFTITAASSNTCGSTSQCLWFCNYGCMIPAIVAPRSAFNLTLYPNPATSTMTVQVTDSASASSNTSGKLSQSYQLNLYDRSGNSFYSTQSDKSILQVPVGSLLPGIYYINVFYKEAVLQRQLLITR